MPSLFSLSIQFVIFKDRRNSSRVGNEEGRMFANTGPPGEPFGGPNALVLILKVRIAFDFSE